MKNRPTWYTNDTDSAWDRVKAAFRNDWEQTKHDFGSRNARDLNQDVDDTVKQAAGTEDASENHEQAFASGYAPRKHDKPKSPPGNKVLEKSLRPDAGASTGRDRAYIRHAYEYRGS